MFTFLVWPLLLPRVRQRAVMGKTRDERKTRNAGPFKSCYIDLFGWILLPVQALSRSVLTYLEPFCTDLLMTLLADMLHAISVDALTVFVNPFFPGSLLCHLSTEKLTPNTLIHGSSWQAWKSTQPRLVFTTNSQECSRELPALLSNSLLFEKS